MLRPKGLSILPCGHMHPSPPWCKHIATWLSIIRVLTLCLLLNDCCPSVLFYPRGRALWSCCKGFFAWNPVLWCAWAHHVIHMFGCVHLRRRRRRSVQEGMSRSKQFGLATWLHLVRHWDASWQWQGEYGGWSSSQGRVFYHICQRCAGFQTLAPSSRTCFRERTWLVCCLLALQSLTHKQRNIFPLTYIPVFS